MEPFWPSLFAKALEGHNLDSLIQAAGSPGAGGAAPAAGGAAPAAGGAAEAKEEEKEEKKEEEEEESDDDMGFGKFNDNWIICKLNCATFPRVLLVSFDWNGHTAGFHPQTQKFKPPCTA